MGSNPAKKYDKPILTKIVIASLLACSAIFISLYISKQTFGRILTTVTKLSTPDRRLQLVNELFKDIVQLEYLQGTATSNNEVLVYNPFIKESSRIQFLLDSLRSVCIDNPPQIDRIDSVKRLLDNRDILFLKYLEVRAALQKSDTLEAQVKSLSEFLEKNHSVANMPSLVTRKTTQITVDTVKPQIQRQTLLKKIFGKRRPQVAIVQKRIEEKLDVVKDTAGRSKGEDSLIEIGKTISKTARVTKGQKALLQKRSEKFNDAGNTLIAQLIRILNDIEQEEFAQTTKENVSASHLVRGAVKNLSAVLVFCVTGIAILVVLILVDISRREKYRRQLVAAREEAEEAGRVKQRFLSNMSHELRTPLQTIIGVAEQVKGCERPARRDLENIYQSSLHLLQIVNEVLDYSRIVSGKFILQEATFNMHDVLEEVTEMIQVQASKKGLHFQCNFKVGKDACYTGDSFRLKQILLNLLGNALKFTERGAITLTVKELAQPDVSHFTFSVADTGSGIEPEDLVVIFKEFEQGSGQYGGQGTGLGLTIVKALVDLQQGRISVRSEVARGSEFVVSLKYARTMPAEAESLPRQVPPAFNGHAWIVDDDAFILQLCSTILSKYGVKHECFRSAKDALAAQPPEDLRVVVLDIRMGEMEGTALCRELRKKARIREAEYIALTAQALPDEQQAIYASGFDRILTKPFLENDFLSIFNLRTSASASEPASFLATVRRMAGGDAELIAETLRNFVVESEQDMARTNEQMAARNFAEQADALHRLAGRCGLVGAADLAARMRQLELRLRDGTDTDTIQPCLQDISTDLAELLSRVKDKLADEYVSTNC